MNDYFLIAKIVSVFGKDGFVRISSYSDFPERFFDLKKVYMDFFGEMKVFGVEKVLKKKDFFVLKFKNFDSEENAQALVGKDLFVDEEDVVELPKDVYFVHDLIGSKVYRNNSVFGTIKDVLSFPANDVYVIEGENGEEKLIPAVRSFVESFDPVKKILVLKPGEDLYDDDED